MARDDEFRTVATTATDQVTEVRIYAETMDHIREEHPEVPIELPVMVEGLVTAITNPTHIEQGHTNSLVYVAADSTNKAGHPLRVPVKIIEGKSGLLKTAYFAETPNTASVIWRKNE